MVLIKEADHRPDLEHQGIKLDGQNGSSRVYAKSSTEAYKITLSELECELINKALEHLINGNNIVLVDIFERVKGGSDNGNVKTKDASCLTHTIVLYKNSDNNALVIDPSNFLFSSHLHNFNNSANKRVTVEIKTIHKDLRVYEPYKPTGVENAQFRDCNDIAVKIAFGLQRLYHQYGSLNFDETNIDQCQALLDISNANINTELGVISALKNPTRIKQSSDPDTVYKFNKLEKILSMEFKVIEDLGLTENVINTLQLKGHNINVSTTQPSVSFINSINKICNSNKSIIDQFSELKSYHEICMTELYTTLNQFADDVSLLGI